MATTIWVAGTLWASWTAVFSTEANSVVSGNAVLSSVAIDNSSAGDTYFDVSCAISSFTSGTLPVLGLYYYPLNQDGTSYGDGRFGTSAAGPPPGSYLIGQCGLVASVTQAQEGAFLPCLSISPKMLLPPWKGKLVLYNGAGGTLGSTVTIKAQSYKLQTS